jgi:hypothetical protein
LLANVPSNSSGGDIERVEGKTRVQYGAVESGIGFARGDNFAQQQKLVFADQNAVTKPQGSRRTLLDSIRLIITRAQQLRTLNKRPLES